VFFFEKTEYGGQQNARKGKVDFRRWGRQNVRRQKDDVRENQMSE
jgi:hypothetical protein